MANDDGVTPVDQITDPVVDPAADSVVDPVDPAAVADPVTFGGGKFNSIEELEDGFLNAQSKIGEQGTELGDARKQISTLTSALDTTQPAPTETVDTVDSQIAEVNSQVENGDLSYTEGMAKIAAIATDQATANAIEGVKQFQNQQQVEASKNDFLSNNPDFKQLQTSGVLDEVKSSLPGLHDDFSAYHAFKAHETATNAEAQIVAAKAEGFEAGKAEMANIASGDDNTQKVLQNPGDAVSIGSGDKPKTKNDLINSGVAAFNAAAP